MFYRMAIWRKSVVCGLALLAGWTAANAGSVLTAVPIQQSVVDDPFWSPKIQVWRQVTIPDVLAKFERVGALRNYDRVRDGLTGGHEGAPFWDGLICEVIRGTADFLAAERNGALEARLDGYIAQIAAAQAKDPDGYLNTHTQLKEPNHRWGLNGGNEVVQHDVYNAGCLIEAGVHYYRATGKTQLLAVGARLANHMWEVMGPSPKHNVIPGHGLPEEAVAKLYQLFHEQPQLKTAMPFAVDENRYLQLAQFWIEIRGHYEGRPEYAGFARAYDQDHSPVLEQTTIEGHAVRATLMCAGLSALAMVNGREDYRQASERLWQNLTGRRMYVTGGAGASAEFEAFAPDYVLPNTGYLESCAAVGSAFFSHNMNLLVADARYADEMERVLYNGALCATSVKGDTYYYQNPLEVNHPRGRWSWHDCPCCPPMFLKLMGALPSYIYAQDANGIYVNLFVGGQTKVELPAGKVGLRQKTQYPWAGKISLRVEPEKPAEFALRIRIPAWCQGAASGEELYSAVGRPATGAVRLKVNGHVVDTMAMDRGYAVIQRRWQAGDEVELAFDMPVRRVKANPKVEADTGRVAIMRGPIVYCLEGVDNPDGVKHLWLPSEAKLATRIRPNLLGGVTVIQGRALGLHNTPSGKVETRSSKITLIPYYANANREPSEMRVWLPETASLAQPKPVPTVANQAKVSASHCFSGDTVAALIDLAEPAASDDKRIPRFTWWDHRGTAEWVQYDFDQPRKVACVQVYWWDERRINAHCRVPESWRLLYWTGKAWKPVPGAASYGTAMDRYNEVHFTPVKTTRLRLEAQLQANWSGGILEWKVK